MSEKIAGVVVLYNPDADEVARNIASYISQLSKLYVVDNTPGGSKMSLLLQNDHRIEYISSMRNEGIGAALNKAAGVAFNEGFHWLLTMDQDSSFDTGVIDNYFSKFNQYFANDGSIAIVAPSHYARTEDEKKEYVQELGVITSGNLLNLKVWREMGGFEEKLFIDEVDYEFCYRANSSGYKIFRFTSILFDHQLGESKSAGYGGVVRKSKRTIHSPARLYFMVRNYLYVKGKYKKVFPVEFKRRDKMILTAIKNNILFSGQFVKSIKSITRGYWDFKNNNFAARL